MSEPLDELYFKWLYSQVGDLDVVNPYATHWRLLKILYTREFIFIVPRDANRAHDGRDLRQEFIDKEGLYDVDEGWLRLPCSVLELLIGLSRHIAFEAEGKPRGWFWTLMENINLFQYNDRRRFSEGTIQDILDRVICRTYDYSGEGGLFPLKEAERDQRDVELWYQMAAYVLENT